MKVHLFEGGDRKQHQTLTRQRSGGEGGPTEAWQPRQTGHRWGCCDNHPTIQTVSTWSHH